MPIFQEADLTALDRRPSAKPYTGWALDRVIDLDRHTPGLLAASFRYGAQRRQGMFLLLAFVDIFGIDEIISHLRLSEITPEFGDATPSAIVGQTILQLRRPRDLVRTILAGPPVGLVGILGRLGFDPIDRQQTYYDISQMFLSRDPIDRRRAKILGQISGALLGTQIEIVSKLDPVLLHPALVSKLYEVKQVEEMQHALAFVRANCACASDDAIRASLGRLRPDNHRSDLIRYWASRFDRPPHDLDVRGDPTLIVLSSAAKMAVAGLKYRNCLKTKISEAFLGASLFVEYRPVGKEPGAIAELRWTNRGYVLMGLYAADNRRVRADRAQVIRQKLTNCDVALLDHAPGDPAMVHTTARMLGQWGSGYPDNDAWGDEPLDAVVDLEQVFDEVA